MTITKDGVPGYHARLGYLFLDFNAFFAAVEQLDDPALRGRPVIVTPLESEHTGAIAASYEARPYGVRRGTSLRDARRLCPRLVVRTARHDRYVEVHHAAKAAIERVVPIHTAYSVDEMACRLSPSEGVRHRAVDLALAVRESLDEALGPTLRASFGLAQTRLLAKLAAERHKPDGLTVLEPGDLPGALSRMALGDVPGIGPGMLRRLAAAGVTDFPGLWAMQPKQARRVWGSVQGERFWYALHGWEAEETHGGTAPPKHMLGHSRVLAREHEAPDQARRVAHALLMKAAARLRHHGLLTTRLHCYAELRSRVPGVEAYEGSAPLPPTDDSALCRRALVALWEEYVGRLTALANGRPLRFGKVSVQLCGLIAVGDERMSQGHLFGDADAGERARRARLWSAVDAINKDEDGRIARAGLRREDEPGSVIGRHVAPASLHGLELDYVGGKIAFSRVPDGAEFAA